jgi:hypothetical protein
MAAHKGIGNTFISKLKNKIQMVYKFLFLSIEDVECMNEVM